MFLYITVTYLYPETPNTWPLYNRLPVNSSHGHLVTNHKSADIQIITELVVLCYHYCVLFFVTFTVYCICVFILLPSGIIND